MFWPIQAFFRAAIYKGIHLYYMLSKMYIYEVKIVLSVKI
jgi:hypothetical protein